jgi:wyosine [tRNA(Phe)-imidazoG37] synthetase (radical SAM superfamily)
MSQILGLKKGLTYGPVDSRRLGRSLGINILPRDAKLCSLDCVYCQYGWTKLHDLRPRSGADLPAPREVRAALEEALRNLPAPPAYITFSGNGEPTLHPDFGSMVDEAIAARDLLAPRAKTAVLSNSTTVGDPAVRGALLRLDSRIMKLDAGSEAVFRKYSRPCPGVDLETITRGLEELARAAPLTIQALFASGKNGNLDSENLNEWRARLLAIRPARVQIYTLARGFPDAEIAPATREKLSEIKDLLDRAGVPSQVF